MDETAFKALEIWVALGQAEELVAEATERSAGGEPAAGALRHVRYIISVLKAHQDASDTIPYSSQTFAAVQSAFNAMMGEIRNYNANANVGHLQNAANYVDGIQNAIGALPPVPKSSQATQAARTFLEYRELVDRSIVDLTTKISEEREKAVELHASDSEQAKALSDSLATLAIEVESLRTKISTDETRLDIALTQNNDAFTTKQTEREERYEKWLSDQSKALLSSAKPTMDKLQEIQGDADKQLDAVKVLRDDVEKVSGKAAAAVLARDYGSYATREWISGVLAYFLGFVLLVVVAVYLVRTVGRIDMNAKPSWQFVALKLGLTLTAATAAGVAFQFGSHALSRSNMNKRVELELRAVGPFLADVDDPEAVKAAKLAFMERMFGRAWEANGSAPQIKESKSGAPDSTLIAKIVEEVVRLRPGG
ncbi:hypothetical protein [Kribbella solani]|uniref:Uncharacterized protein n=1 Tax=Kribbella solani TaxID=236067 RepID=A0A841DU55_9ACTN|nr:hypothetical protein [Kribbella solani]MBB5979817.1 hypothetical protein [Kribbella solani]